MADIEILIRIPEDIYKRTKIFPVKPEDVLEMPLKVIQDGTILPKGHGDLIDAKKLDKDFYDYTDCGNVFIELNYDNISNKIDDALPIIKADKEQEDD